MKFLLVAALCILVVPGTFSQGATTPSSGGGGGGGLGALLSRVLKPVGQILIGIGPLVGEHVSQIGAVIDKEKTPEEALAAYKKTNEDFKKMADEFGGLAKGVGSIVYNVFKGLDPVFNIVFKILGAVVGNRGGGGGMSMTMATTAAA